MCSCSLKELTYHSSHPFAQGSSLDLLETVVQLPKLLIRHLGTIITDDVVVKAKVLQTAVHLEAFSQSLAA